jgi:hypothetical protein
MLDLNNSIFIANGTAGTRSCFRHCFSFCRLLSNVATANTTIPTSSHAKMDYRPLSHKKHAR